MADENLTQQDTPPAAPAGSQAPAGSAAPAPSPDEEMVELSVLDMLELVPPQVKDFLLSDEVTSRRKRIFDKFELTEEEKDIELNAELDVFFGLLKLEDFPDVLYTLLEWGEEEEDRAAFLAADVAGYLFLPAEAYLGDVRGLIESLGVDPEQYPKDRIKLARLTYPQAAALVAEKAGVTGLDAEMMRRLERIIEARIRNVRDDMETREQLVKGTKVGGVGLSESHADFIVSVIPEVVGANILVEPEEARKEAMEAQISALDIKRRLLGSVEEQETLAMRRTTLSDDGKTDEASMRRKLKDAVLPPENAAPEMWLVVAALLMTAEADGLVNVLKEDGWAQDIVKGYLESIERKADIKAFEDNPVDPRFMGIFLQLLLRRYAGLEMQDSARYGLRILGVMKRQGHPEYAGLAALDMRDGQFRWVRPELL